MRSDVCPSDGNNWWNCAGNNKELNIIVIAKWAKR